MEMWERERVDNLVKKEIDEEEVCKDALEMKLDITHNLDQMIAKVCSLFFNFFLNCFFSSCFLIVIAFRN